MEDSHAKPTPVHLHSVGVLQVIVLDWEEDGGVMKSDSQVLKELVTTVTNIRGITDESLRSEELVCLVLYS
jgi:hypothetical protein